jgi:hypothetical protein
MRKILFAIALILALTKSALASPVINGITFEPSSSLWIGESLSVKINCTDELNSISGVKLSAIGEDGYTIPTKDLTFQSGLYTTTIESLYLSYPNKFSVNITCINNNSESVSQTQAFEVSSFTTIIPSITPSTIYLGDLIEVDVVVKRNNEQISSGVSFIVKLNDSIVQPKVQPPYDPSKGWIIYLDAPNISGQYSLAITTSYGRVSDTKTVSLTINEPILFSITGIDKTLVRPNDTITLQLKALDRGNTIPLTSSNVEIQVGSTKAEIKAITPVSNYYNLVITAPSLYPDNYKLTAYLYYKNYTYSDSTTISYIVPVSGKITDENGKGISTELKFLSGSTEKLRLYTDSSGAYSGYLPPGTYDLQITFPQSVLYLSSVNIRRFEDPIRYYYSTSVDIPGINLVGLYVYEVALPYSQATIEMKYDERNVLDESTIKVYKCEKWNNGKKICYGSWEEVTSNVDTVRNLVSVTTSSLSAYALGTLKQLSVDFSLNKESFYLKDLIRISGIVLDESRNAVSNATVSISLKGTSINTTTTTDSNGIFQTEFIGPESEGSYALLLKAEKYPYISFNTSKELKFERSKEFSIVFPDTVRVAAGENFTQELDLINTGQSDLYSLQIFITGIPASYYRIEKTSEDLKVGETKKIKIYFSIPSDANQTTLSASLTVFNDQMKKEKTFGFTVLASNKTVSQPTGITGKAVLPEIDWNVVFIILFALASFSLAFILKRRKVSRGREEVRSLLFDLKNRLKMSFIEQKFDPIEKEGEYGKNN